MIENALDVSTEGNAGGESVKVDRVAFLAEARRRFQVGLDADSIDRAEAELDNTFANATDAAYGQWDPIPLQSRRDNHRPVLQWNRIPTYVQQVVNDGRQNKPSIKISAGDGGKKVTADFFQSRIRQVEYDCNADVAYDTARDQQVTSGRGFIRVFTKYTPGTFDQKICIERIENQFSVVFDPASMAYDRSDADWCFVVSKISKAEHERRYGVETTVSREDFTALWMDYPQWIGVGDKSDLIQIAEYWVAEYKKRTLCLLGTTGLPTWKDDLTPEQYKTFKANGVIQAEREEQERTIRRYVINGCEILEEGDWIGTTIPIVPIYGREAVVDGVRRTYSLIRMAKDPQRLVNLYVSNIAEQIAMMPKAPWIAPVGSIAENHLPAWRDAGTTAKAVLFYKEWDEQNRQLSRPSRVVTEPPIQALAVGLSQSIDAIKAAMGIYDASLGARSNETSGVAIERRKKSAEIVNFHFGDNESRSRKRIGEILLELIPKLDKPGSEVPIRHEDGKTEVVPIGTPFQHPKTGEEVVHNLTEGNYGLVVSTQASYESARAEEHERLVQIVEAQPDLMMIVGDQIFRTSDFPGSEDIADRMEKYIKMKNPGIIQEKGDQKHLPPEVQQQFVQLQQKLQTTEQFAQSLHEKLETKQPELDNQVKLKEMQLQFDREKLAVDNTTKVAVEEIKLGIQSDLELLHHEIDLLKLQNGLDAEKQAQEAEHQQAEKMADKSHAQALEQGEQAQAGALEQGQQAADLAPTPETK